VLAVCGLLAVVAFVSSLVARGFVVGFDRPWWAIPLFSLPYQPEERIGLGAFGGFLLAFAIGLWLDFVTVRRKRPVGAVLIGAAGAAAIISALFPLNQRDPASIGYYNGFFGAAVVVSLMTAPFGMWGPQHDDPRWRRLAPLTQLVGSVLLATFVISLLFFGGIGNAHTIGFTLIFFGVALSWVASTAAGLLVLQSRPGRSSRSDVAINVSL